jgi:microcystin-dependent protein
MTIPSNIIIIWSGTIQNIPDGWYLCDGTNNTPNLRDRFVVGAGSSYNLNATGGSKDAIVPAHSHSFVSINSGGNHSHTINRFSGNQNGSYFNVGGVGGANRHSYAFGGNATLDSRTIPSHNHSGGTVNLSGVDGTDKNLPPYYALAYIMKGAE